MRVLHVMEPGFGGVLRHVEGLVAGQLARGCEVSLAYSSRRPSERLIPLVKRVRHAGGAVLDMQVGNAPCPADLKATRNLYRLAAGADVIHAHSSKAGALARPVARLLGKPCFYTPNAYFGMGRRGMKSFLFNLVERLLAGQATTINVSPEELDFARLLGVRTSRQVLIPNGVDCDYFTPVSQEEKALARRHLGLPRDAVVLGSLGRLTFQKDPETLYWSFARFAARNPQARLLHLGEGELAGALAEILARENMAGRVLRLESLADPRPFYAALDGFVLTSRYEGLPISALEALACNLPIVLSQAPGNGYFARLGLSQLYYARVGDSDDFARAFEEWSQGLGARLNHREVCARELSLERNCSLVLAAYRNGR